MDIAMCCNFFVVILSHFYQMLWTSHIALLTSIAILISYKYPVIKLHFNFYSVVSPMLLYRYTGYTEYMSLFK